MPDMPEMPAMVVIGLGNPGQEFAGTRHNVGADVVRLLAQRHVGARFKLEKRNRAVVAPVMLGRSKVILGLPTTYMNESGYAARALLKYYAAGTVGNLLVVHDELDLPVGRVKLKLGGGTAGHNGLKSVQAHLNSSEFVRVRVGIGKPTGVQSGADFVLSRPTRSEHELLDTAIREAVDAVELICEEGLEAAMTSYNKER